MGKTNTNWQVVKIFSEEANRIDCKRHFNPKEFGITITEIAKVRFTRSCKYNINYHYVWIPKTRMKILVEPFRSDVETILLESCDRLGFFPLALQIMPDHIHFFLSAPPKFAPSVIIQKLKAESSRNLRKKYSIIRSTRILDKGTEQEKDSKDFWATGYYVGTAGHVSADQVAKYIFEQTNELKKKWSLFDIKPFEYDINTAKFNPKDQTTLCAFGA